MKSICFFREMKLYNDTGSIHDHMVDNEVNYEKERIIRYLLNPKFRRAGCPRSGIDCVTGKEISISFFIYTDVKCEWGDFLPYHIRKYSIALSDDFIEHILKSKKSKNMQNT